MARVSKHRHSTRASRPHGGGGKRASNATGNCDRWMAEYNRIAPQNKHCALSACHLHAIEDASADVTVELKGLEQEVGKMERATSRKGWRRALLKAQRLLADAEDAALVSQTDYGTRGEGPSRRGRKKLHSKARRYDRLVKEYGLRMESDAVDRCGGAEGEAKITASRDLVNGNDLCPAARQQTREEFDDMLNSLVFRKCDEPSTKSGTTCGRRCWADASAQQTVDTDAQLLFASIAARKAAEELCDAVVASARRAEEAQQQEEAYFRQWGCSAMSVEDGAVLLDDIVVDDFVIGDIVGDSWETLSSISHDSWADVA